MSGYRFCRTDDLPLLAEACNRALVQPPGGGGPVDVPRLKAWVRDLDLWCSSCLVAFDDAARPIGVLLGCKRPQETLVMEVAVHPDHRRKGHGAHLLSSLSSKLAILGPPALAAEVPEDAPGAAAFFAASGYAAGDVFRDFSCAPLGQAVVAAGVVPVSFDDLEANDVLDPEVPRPWSRVLEALRRRRADLQGLALVSPDGFLAWVLWRQEEGRRRIAAAGSPAGAAVLALVLRDLAGRPGGPLLFERVHEREVPWPWLEAAGFGAGRTWRRFTARAQAA